MSELLPAARHDAQRQPAKQRWKTRVFVLLLSLGIVGVAVLIVPLLASDPEAPQLSWADKLTALGTVGAVVVTLGITLTTYLRERRERRAAASERLREQRMGQALQVHWWLEQCPEHVPVWQNDDYGATWRATRTLEGVRNELVTGVV